MYRLVIVLVQCAYTSCEASHDSLKRMSEAIIYTNDPVFHLYMASVLCVWRYAHSHFYVYTIEYTCAESHSFWCTCVWISSGYGLYCMYSMCVYVSPVPHQVQSRVVTYQCLVNYLSLWNGLDLPSVALVLFPLPTVRPCTKYSLVIAHTMEEIGRQCMYMYMWSALFTLLLSALLHACWSGPHCS